MSKIGQLTEPRSLSGTIKTVSPLAPEIILPQDLGLKWNDLGTISFGGSAIVSLKYLGNGIALGATESGHIFRSTDYGQNWTDEGLITSFNGIFPHIISYLGNGITILGNLFGHTFRSIDFGQTWIDQGMIASTSITSITYIGNGIVIVTDDFGHVIRSTDYGKTWVDEGSITPPGVGLPDSTYVGNGIVITASDPGRIFRSTDSGLTWTDEGLVGTGVNTLESIENGISLFADQFSHIFRSTDFGLTWTDEGVIGGASTFSYMGNGIVIFGASRNIFKSTNFGQTWTDEGIISGVGIKTISYLGNGISIFGNSDGHIFREDVAFKTNEAQVNEPKIPVNQTSSRALNTTYTNSDSTRSLEIIVGASFVITSGGGNAYMQAKADTSAPPTTLASPITGIQSGLNGQTNNIMLVAIVRPGLNYRVDSTTANGTVTLDKWFETFI